MRLSAEHSAFTLLELLVALALMGALAAALYASLHIGFRARTGAEAALAPTRSAAIALDMARRDLEAIPPPRGVLAGSFTGADAKTDRADHDSDVLDFTTCVADASTSGPVMRKIELGLTVAADGKTGNALVRRMTSNLLAPKTPDPVEEVLCRNVLSFNARYYDGTVWQDSWDSTTVGNVLPVAVELTLRISTSNTTQTAAPLTTQTTLPGYVMTRMILLPCGEPVAAAGGTTTGGDSTGGGNSGFQLPSFTVPQLRLGN